MPTRACLFWGVLWLVVASPVWAAEPSKEPAAKDSPPWHIVKVAKSDAPRGGKTTEATNAKPRKYLRVGLDFLAGKDDRGKHKFRIVNNHGDEVGDLWGWNESQSLVVFEGDWSDLKGLYLDGSGHREPLLPARPKKPHAKPAKPDKQDKAKTTSPSCPGPGATGGCPAHGPEGSHAAVVPGAGPEAWSPPAPA